MLLVLWFNVKSLSERREGRARGYTLSIKSGPEGSRFFGEASLTEGDEVVLCLLWSWARLFVVAGGLGRAGLQVAGWAVVRLRIWSPVDGWRAVRLTIVLLGAVLS